MDVVDFLMPQVMGKFQSHDLPPQRAEMLENGAARRIDAYHLGRLDEAEEEAACVPRGGLSIFGSGRRPAPPNRRCAAAGVAGVAALAKLKAARVPAEQALRLGA